MDLITTDFLENELGFTIQGQSQAYKVLENNLKIEIIDRGSHWKVALLHDNPDKKGGAALPKRFEKKKELIALIDTLS